MKQYCSLMKQSKTKQNEEEESDSRRSLCVHELLAQGRQAVLTCDVI